MTIILLDLKMMTMGYLETSIFQSIPALAREEKLGPVMLQSKLDLEFIIPDMTTMAWEAVMVRMVRAWTLGAFDPETGEYVVSLDRGAKTEGGHDDIMSYFDEALRQELGWSRALANP